MSAKGVRSARFVTERLVKVVHIVALLQLLRQALVVRHELQVRGEEREVQVAQHCHLRVDDVLHLVRLCQ